MEIKSTNNTSLIDYLKSNSSSKVASNYDSGFDEVFTKTSSSNSSSKAENFYDNKNNYSNDGFNKTDKNSNFGTNDTSYNNNNVKTKDDAINNNTTETNKNEPQKNNEVSDEKNIKPEKKEKPTNKDKEVDDADLEKLNKLAELLNMTAEELTVIMDELKLSVEDLSEFENIKMLLMAVNNLESPADLLTLDNLKEQISYISDLSKEVTVKEDLVAETESLISDEEVVISLEEADSNEDGSFQGQNSSSQGNLENDLFKDVVDIEVKENSYSETTATKDVNTEVVEGSIPLVNQQEVVQENNLISEEFNISSEIKVNNDNVLSAVKETLSSSSTDTHNVVKQITEAMKFEIKGEFTNEIKITLRPQHLGDVTLKIVSENGIITAQFEAESQRVKEIIEANFNQLRESLKEQGINISDLAVNVNQNNQNNDTNSQFGNRRKQNLNGEAIDGENIEIEDNIKTISEEVAVGSSSSFKA